MDPSYFAGVTAEQDPAPSRELTALKINVLKAVPQHATAIGVPVGIEGEVPKDLGLDRKALLAAGFEGKVGQTFVVAHPGATLYAVGIGHEAELDAAKLRDAAASFSRAARRHEDVTFRMARDGGMSPEDAAQAFVEGALLARYRYTTFKDFGEGQPALRELNLVSSNEAAKKGAARGAITARAVYLARDLANAPATLLTARRMADIAVQLGKATGLEVEIFDEKALAEMGCGGMLSVNAGSAEPPRLIKLTYRPKGEAVGHLAMIGKGIMYDSGGISLKPNDLIHATMKQDMSGAGAILCAMSTLKEFGCKAEVVGYLMCTDNMPSGAAMRLGDVFTARGGKTVEVLNTDAEGRLVMCDGLALATEQKPRPDAIVDIATLTGACQRALGNLTAGLIGNHQALVDQVKASAERTDETVWQLPLDRRMRPELDSDIADLKNVGGDHGGAIHAALYLEEFVDGLPWAHLDIAGTARSEKNDSWRARGSTGYGTRLLIDFIAHFVPPTPTRH